VLVFHQLPDLLRIGIGSHELTVVRLDTMDDGPGMENEGQDKGVGDAQILRLDMVGLAPEHDLGV